MAVDGGVIGNWSRSGDTRVAAVIGSPIRHSRSPAIHNAAFAALGLDWVYVAFEVAPGAVPAAFEGVRALRIDGLSVTMPHKDAAAASVDELSDDARRLGAVNCVVRDGGRLVGHNTDGPGFVNALADAGGEVAGRSCVVVGAGGAARAVILALARAGAREVAVVNRTPANGVEAAAVAGSLGRLGTLDDIPGADLVVNATSVGMGETDPVGGATPFPVELLRASQFVADLVVHPVETPLLRAAAACGAIPVDGIGMLVHQAAIAFERWTGHAPPVSVMQAAARTENRH